MRCWARGEGLNERRRLSRLQSEGSPQQNDEMEGLAFVVRRVVAAKGMPRVWADQPTTPRST